MIDLYKEIDFQQVLEGDNELKHFLLQACRKVQQQQSDQLRKIKKPELDDQLMNQFVVSGIPILKSQQVDKFIGVFKNNLLGKRAIGDKNGLIDISAGIEQGQSTGNQTLYLTYKTPTEAKVAFGKLNNLKFDKDHRMTCVWVNDLRNIIQENETQGSTGIQFRSPNLTTTKERRQHNLDQQFRSQFLFRQDKMVYLQLLDHLDKSAKTALNSQFMQLEYSINKMVFSPRGSYLAVCCQEGIHIFVGPELKYKGFLRQASPVDAKFSQDQRFLVTSNGGLKKNRQNLIIWAVEQEVKIKSYRAQKGQNLQTIQFSQDGKNLAVALGNQVIFFKTNTVQELIKQVRAPQQEQHMVKAVFVQKVAWLKSQNDIIIMCYEPDYNPVSAAVTRIFLYNCETKVERKWRAWSQHAKAGQIFVSEKGQWVAIALRKFVRKGHFATSIQIGNLLKKEDPIQISSLQFKQDVGNISFDSYNNRMAVIYKDQTFKTINIRYIVSFYELPMKNRSLEIIKVGEINNNLQNRVVLASNGAFFALYNLSQDSAERGRFSMGMIVKQQKEKGKKGLNFQFTKRDLMANGMSFFSVDESGRFILLSTEKGYQIWNFIGQNITKDTLQKSIHDVQWRPRMFNRLAQEGEKGLIEHEKEIRKKYEIIDEEKRIQSLGTKQREKIQRKRAFLDFVSKKNQWFKGFAEKRQKIIGFKEFDVRTDKYEVQQNFIDLQ